MSVQKKDWKRIISIIRRYRKKIDNNQIKKNNNCNFRSSKNKYQPRIIFDQEKLEELSMSIKENGVFNQ